jgi:hypothetical protein
MSILIWPGNVMRTVFLSGTDLQPLVPSRKKCVSTALDVTETSAKDWFRALIWLKRQEVEVGAEKR